MTVKLCECGCGEPAPIATETRRQAGHVKGEPMRFVRGHATRGREMPKRNAAPDYLADPETGCWIWQKARSNGYGSKVLFGSRTTLAHRWYYEQFVGPIPAGYEVHHRCHNPACVNPAHLEALSSQAHSDAHRRATCRRGHEYTPETTYITPQGFRQCRVCRRLRSIEFRARRKATA